MFLVYYTVVVKVLKYDDVAMCMCLYDFTCDVFYSTISFETVRLSVQGKLMAILYCEVTKNFYSI